MRCLILPNEIWIAGAGSGKTHKIISDAVEIIKDGGRVLVVTYTTNNQAELRARFVEFNDGKTSENFVVKGLFQFYLEDMIRPYQTVVFPGRIANHSFTENNPHHIPGAFVNGRPVFFKGRAEKLPSGAINSLHYLTPCKTMAYSGYLGKLAALVAKRSKDAPAKRISLVYQKIFFDEVQDLVGYDYDVIKSISKHMPDGTCCVGDFRQTIYSTTFGQKAPLTPQAKIDYFLGQLKFVEHTMPTNQRCIQEICDLSDTINPGVYGKTTSTVKDVPAEMSRHLGCFVVRQSEVADYLAAFQPQVLRWNAKVGIGYLQPNLVCYNFGSCKGLGFDRVLVIPAENQLKFLAGDGRAFDKDKTGEARNKLYVAITRARYSLAFLVEDKKVKTLALPLWSASEVGHPAAPPAR
jgi:DNA helicase-2/ATP-dependent DNA helicase PcrA